MPSYSHPNVQTYALGDLALESGETLPNAHIAYLTLGDPSLPAILYPTWYSGLIADNLWLVQPHLHLNPSRYHIIIPALFGNSESASPSTHPHLHPFPAISLHDNVAAQHRLLTSHLHIPRLRAVVGWSMGAAQAFQWATQFPAVPAAIVPFCGAARCSPHNAVFLEGVKAALLAARGAQSAGVSRGPAAAPAAWSAEQRETGLKALGRVYAGWGFSQAFYRERRYEGLGFASVEEFLVGFWEAWALGKEPENLLCMLGTWQGADVARQRGWEGDLGRALGSVRARCLVMPCRTDLYFTVEDSEEEVRLLGERGELVVFESVWGHWAGGPGQSVEDVKFLDEQLARFLPGL